jgi:hypothetical protein
MVTGESAHLLCYRLFFFLGSVVAMTAPTLFPRPPSLLEVEE